MAPRELKRTSTRAAASPPSLEGEIQVPWRHLEEESSQWVTKIHFAGKTEHLGYFDDWAEPGRAYDKRARQLGRPPT